MLTLLIEFRGSFQTSIKNINKHLKISFIICNKYHTRKQKHFYAAGIENELLKVLNYRLFH